MLNAKNVRWLVSMVETDVTINFLVDVYFKKEKKKKTYSYISHMHACKIWLIYLGFFVLSS